MLKLCCTENYPSGLRGSSLLLRSVRRRGRSNRSFSANIMLECQHKIVNGTLIFYIMKNYFKSIFKNWNIFDIVFLFGGLLIEVTLFVIFNGKWYELIYSILYFLTALLMAKRKIVCCIIGIISTAFYAAVAYFQKYYGEMIVALLFTFPLMIFTLVTWSKNKDDEDDGKVKPNIKGMRIELALLILSQFMASVGYYFLLKHFNTDNLILSVISVAVSFVASWLAMRRSNYLFIAYVMNDIILITLWSQPLVARDYSIIPIVFGQALLLINDIYGFIVWTRKVLEERKNKKNEFFKE